MFCSHSQWYNVSEKNTKYFFNLEKMRYNAKTIQRIVLKNGSITRNKSTILQEQKRYYSELYTANPTTQFTF